MRKSISQITVLVGLSLISWAAILYEQDIRDWWILRSYDPPMPIASLADKADMSPEGERIFYVSRPEINARTEFNENCSFVDKSLVLGCYHQERIYIYDVTDERLDGIKEVTAAHEMLHAAYARMSDDERAKVDRLTAEAVANLTDERILEVVDNYRSDDPASVPNELHSILGTEVSDLPQELEEHYARFFDDRQNVVNLAKGYESVFAAIDDKLEETKLKIDQLAKEIIVLSSELAILKEDLDSDSARLTSLRGSGNISEYNAGVPAYNSKVNRYNELIKTYKNTISAHNQLVEDYNKLAVTQNQLIQSINSQYDLIPN